MEEAAIEILLQFKAQAHAMIPVSRLKGKAKLAFFQVKGKIPFPQGAQGKRRIQFGCKDGIAAGMGEIAYAAAQDIILSLQPHQMVIPVITSAHRQGAGKLKIGAGVAAQLQ